MPSHDTNAECTELVISNPPSKDNEHRSSRERELELEIKKLELERTIKREEKENTLLKIKLAEIEQQNKMSDNKTITDLTNGVMDKGDDLANKLGGTLAEKLAPLAKAILGEAGAVRLDVLDRMGRKCAFHGNREAERLHEKEILLLQIKLAEIQNSTAETKRATASESNNTAHSFENIGIQQQQQEMSDNDKKQGMELVKYGMDLNNKLALELLGTALGKAGEVRLSVYTKALDKLGIARIQQQQQTQLAEIPERTTTKQQKVDWLKWSIEHGSKESKELLDSSNKNISKNIVDNTKNINDANNKRLTAITDKALAIFDEIEEEAEDTGKEEVKVEAEAHKLDIARIQQQQQIQLAEIPERTTTKQQKLDWLKWSIEHGSKESKELLDSSNKSIVDNTKNINDGNNKRLAAITDKALAIFDEAEEEAEDTGRMSRVEFALMTMDKGDNLAKELLGTALGKAGEVRASHMKQGFSILGLTSAKQQITSEKETAEIKRATMEKRLEIVAGSEKDQDAFMTDLFGTASTKGHEQRQATTHTKLNIVGKMTDKGAAWFDGKHFVDC